MHFLAFIGMHIRSKVSGELTVCDYTYIQSESRIYHWNIDLD